MEITAHLLDGCRACEKQKSNLPTGTTLKDARNTGKKRAPIVEVDCGDGSTRQFVGLTPEDKIEGACQR